MSSPDPPWVDAWLNNRVMPPHSFPDSLLEPMRSRAEAWMLSDNGPRRQVEEFVSRDQSYDIMDGLLFSGFCRDRSQPDRIPPVPVIVQLLYVFPPQGDQQELENLMASTFARVFRDWCRLHVSGRHYEVAP
jgi:hypothetical protein